MEMPDEPQALAAIAALSGKEFMGRALKVNPAYLKKEFQPGRESGKKAWPKVMYEGQEVSPGRENRENPGLIRLLTSPGHMGAPGARGSYMKRDGSTEIREEAKPWRKREDQSRPWQKKTE